MSEIGSVQSLRFGWRPNIERLRQEAKRALQEGRAEPWALVETECWLDLIDAEVKACQRARELDMSTEIKALAVWRSELKSLAKTFQRLNSPWATGREKLR